MPKGGENQSLSSHPVLVNTGSSCPQSCAVSEHAAGTREVTERGQ